MSSSSSAEIGNIISKVDEQLINAVEPSSTDTSLYNGHLRTMDRYFRPKYSMKIEEPLYNRQ